VTYLDSALLNVTEWVCRRFQVLTGRTNVWLAFQLTNLSIIVFFIWAGMHFVIGDRPMRIFVAAFSGALLYLLTQTIFKVPVEAYENSAYRRLARGLGNPRRVQDMLLRVPFLTLTIVLLYPALFVYVNLHLAIFGLTYCLIVLTTMVLYLLACDPLPPCPGKVREWIRGVVPARAAAAPDPVRD
jgi:hypothetical protein